MFATPMLDSSAPQRPPLGGRVTVVAALDGVFDLSGLDLYLPSGSRYRQPTRRVMTGTLRRKPGPFPRYTAMVFDETRHTLEPVEMPGYAPLEVR